MTQQFKGLMDKKVVTDPLKNQFDYISFFTFDGSYLNQINVFKLMKPLNLVFNNEEDVLSHTQVFDTQQVTMMKMVGFDAKEYP